MNDHTTTEIEEIQEQAIIALGREPFEIRKDVASDENSEEIDKIIQKGINVEGLKMSIPEKFYSYDPEYLLGFAKPTKTKYDRSPFLQRFFNADALCHEYFINELNKIKLPIRLSSLPFTQINGVCFYSSNNNPVVLMNEGLLYIVPELLKHSLNFTCLREIYDKIEEGGQIGKKARSDLQVIIENNISPFFEIYLQILGGEILASDMKTKLGRKYGPNSFETWKIRQILEEKIRLDRGENKHEARKASQKIGLVKKGRYFATRGFYILLTGHEFSHFYREHHKVRSNKEAQRNEKETKEFLKKIRTYTRNPTLPLNVLDSEHFLINQPTEVEADSDGLRCVVKYCLDNGLEDEDLAHAIKGALSAFVYMEVTDRLANLCNTNLIQCEELRTMPEELRNALYATEHPCPLSRVYLALDHVNWEGEYEIAKEYIADMWKDMHFTLDWIWCLIAENLYEGIQSHKFKVNCQMNRSELFKNFSAIGCFDDALLTNANINNS